MSLESLTHSYAINKTETFFLRIFEKYGMQIAYEFGGLAVEILKAMDEKEKAEMVSELGLRFFDTNEIKIRIL